MTAYTAIVEKQRRFFKSGKTQPIEFRIEQLETMKRMLKENVDKISDAVYKDIHRSKPQAYCYEVSNVIIEIDYMIDNIADWSKPHPVEKTMMTMLDSPMVKKDPLGVVLIITPWNYPINMAFLPLVPAIAAGNTAIIKPSEIAPHCADVIAEMVAKYFDPEFLAVIKGGVKETTELLKERFDHILYTGAPPVGKLIMAAAAKHLTPVTLELGGKCPVIVEKDADIEIAGKRIAWGKWLNCGQTCLAPDYILTTAEVKPKLVAAMKKAVDSFYEGNPKTHNDYARVINDRHFERLSTLLDKTEGTVLMGGERDKSDLYIQPTILDVKATDAFMKDEIFGPVLPIVTIKSLDEALEHIKDGEKPLAAYIFTN
uniref:Aldehyde dehydrogenase domain-containing protein n=1 Tax=Plectus sambesii TaxID=2011161 RepID=A0A914XQ08_9BILA